MAAAYDTFAGELLVPAGGVHVYTCPAAGTAPDITISYADVEHHSSMTVVEPQFVVTTNATGTGPLTHLLDAGAGWMHRIGVGNYWTVDEAGRSVPYSNWSSGTLVWKIPIGWKRLLFEDENYARTDKYDYERHRDVNSRPLRIGNREDAYTQEFSISENGTSYVEKFGHRLTWSRWSISGEVTNTR